jgi:hypothetical protein
VAVEGEFRRLVHYVDDLVDGRRAIRDDWGEADFRASAIAACIDSAWLAVSPSGLCPGSTVRAVPVVRCTAAPSRMTARPQGSFTRLREASV